LTTLEKANPLAKGVQELVKKGFTGLSASPVSVPKHTKGVFTKATRLTKLAQASLSSIAAVFMRIPEFSQINGANHM
ncbi:unnamed protein product, partial [Ectocarpus sp. 12 AP-2014]